MKWFAIILIVFSLNTVASDVRNKIVFNPSGNVSQGDTVSISMQLWPVEDYDINLFNALKGKTIFSHFYVTDVKARVSENNADVVLLDFDTIAESGAEKNKSIVFSFGNYTTQSTLPFSIVATGEIDGTFKILDQFLSLKRNKWVVIVVVILIVTALGFVGNSFYFRSNKKKKLKKKVLAEKTKYQTLFHGAKEREHYEEIMKDKNIWLQFFSEKNSAINDFFRVMEEHQYKKTWDKEELFHVKEAFDKIRGGIR